MFSDTELQNDVRAALRRDPRIERPAAIAVYADEIGSLTLRGAVGAPGTRRRFRGSTSGRGRPSSTPTAVRAHHPRQRLRASEPGYVRPHIRVVVDRAGVTYRFGTRICPRAPLEKRFSSTTSSLRCSSSSANGLRPAPIAIGTVISWYSSTRPRRVSDAAKSGPP